MCLTQMSFCFGTKQLTNNKKNLFGFDAADSALIIPNVGVAGEDDEAAESFSIAELSFQGKGKGCCFGKLTSNSNQTKKEEEKKELKKWGGLYRRKRRKRRKESSSALTEENEAKSEIWRKNSMGCESRRLDNH
eukprot:GHVP01051402.1.p1 GENE.GHVP01051402.1~~GHVP01051402.1.p1  ORF type:complete len:134 (+),score=42.73 GHVP01051402.1:691-1092(+)